jgi:hypothetical protein
MAEFPLLYPRNPIHATSLDLPSSACSCQGQGSWCWSARLLLLMVMVCRRGRATGGPEVGAPPGGGGNCCSWNSRTTVTG